MLTKREIEVLELRKKGLKQSEAAKKLGVTQAAISLFEKNAHRKIRDTVKDLQIIKKMGIKYDEDER